LTLIFFICSICSGDIFGMLFIASDLVVISHNPAFIGPAAQTVAAVVISVSVVKAMAVFFMAVSLE
jgi:hypothetical protein